MEDAYLLTQAGRLTWTDVMDMTPGERGWFIMRLAKDLGKGTLSSGGD